jgi:spore coat protein U-like protein
VRWINLFASAIVFFFCAQEVLAQNCSISAVPVQFGEYSTFAVSPLDAVGSISVTCDLNIPFMIKLDSGINSSGNFHPRKLNSILGSYALDYNLYLDSARTMVWGDATNNTYITSGVGINTSQQFSVFGRIPGRQNVGVESYTDIVTVILEW